MRNSSTHYCLFKKYTQTARSSCEHTTRYHHFFLCSSEPLISQKNKQLLISNVVQVIQYLSEQRGQHCTARPVLASCSPSAPPDHLVIWRGPLVYAPWCQKLASTVCGGGRGFFCALAVSLSHCLALLLSFQYS
jgi:hypothetical protein